MKKYIYQRSVAFDRDTVDKINDLKERFDMKFSEIIRECVEFDLPRFKERHTKAKQRKQGRYRDA